MAEIRRPFTEQEHGRVLAALPASLKPLMAHIEYIKTNCWNCVHYEGYEGMPGRCKQFDCDIPNDQRGKDQECFEIRRVPF